MSKTEYTTYEDLNVIGTGAYGTVYKARNRTNDTFVALKKIRVSLTEDGVPLNTLREIALLKQLDSHEHPNIVRLLDVCHGQRSENELVMFLVFEHVDQDLASFLDKMANSRNLLSNDKIRNISREIISGVDFLHSQRIVHRDLKPQNILVTQNCHIKLADFGLAKTYDFEMRLTTVSRVSKNRGFVLVDKQAIAKNVIALYSLDIPKTKLNKVVTLWYRSPEVLLGQSYATPVDIWSVGCIMAELFMLKPLFCGSSEGDQLSKIFQILGKPREDEWPATNVFIHYNSFEVKNKIDIKSLIRNICDNAFDLIMRMLTFNPCQRISASDALNHEYFLEEPLEM